MYSIGSGFTLNRWIGPDGNIWKLGSKETSNWGDEPDEITNIKQKLVDKQKPLNEKIDELTTAPDGVGSHFWGSCQYYSIWQMYHTLHLLRIYEYLDENKGSSELGVTWKLGDMSTTKQVGEIFAEQKTEEIKWIRECYGEDYISIGMNQRWDVWFEDFKDYNMCIDEKISVKLPYAAMYPKLSKTARKRLLRIQKTKLTRVEKWLDGIEGDSSKLSDEYKEIFTEVSSKVYLKNKYISRVQKKDGNYRSKAKQKKIKCKHILWKEFEPGYVQNDGCFCSMGVPIECAPKHVQQALKKKQEAEIIEQTQVVCKIKTPLHFMKYLLIRSDMWCVIPKIFKMFWPNSEINVVDSKSPKDYGSNLMNDWSENYRIGVMCFILKDTLISLDNDFYCGNT